VLAFTPLGGILGAAAFEPDAVPVAGVFEHEHDERTRRLAGCGRPARGFLAE